MLSIIVAGSWRKLGGNQEIVYKDICGGEVRQESVFSDYHTQYARQYYEGEDIQQLHQIMQDVFIQTEVGFKCISHPGSGSCQACINVISKKMTDLIHQAGSLYSEHFSMYLVMAQELVIEMVERLEKDFSVCRVFDVFSGNGYNAALMKKCRPRICVHACDIRMPLNPVFDVVCSDAIQFLKQSPIDHQSALLLFSPGDFLVANHYLKEGYGSENIRVESKDFLPVVFLRFYLSKLLRLWAEKDGGVVVLLSPFLLPSYFWTSRSLSESGLEIDERDASFSQGYLGAYSGTMKCFFVRLKK